jgi:hypothetical protein
MGHLNEQKREKGKGGIIKEVSKAQSEAQHSTAQQSKPHSTDSTRVIKWKLGSFGRETETSDIHTNREREREPGRKREKISTTKIVTGI